MCAHASDLAWQGPVSGMAVVYGTLPEPGQPLAMGTTQQEKLELDHYFTHTREVVMYPLYLCIPNVLLYNTCVNSSFSYI